jgi:hypothetical protein
MHEPRLLISAAARSLTVWEIFRLGGERAFDLFRDTQWGRNR